MTSGFSGSVNAAEFTIDEKGKKPEIKHRCGVSCKRESEIVCRRIYRLNGLWWH